MSKGVNKAIIVGNLGADPEMRYSADGTAIAKLNVATSESWKDKKSGEFQERTEWHRITLFNRLGEVAGQYLRKGSKVYIEGSLRTNKWQDQNGNDRYTTEIVASNMQMLDAKGSTGTVPQGAPPAMAEASTTTSETQTSTTAEEPAFEDEIPF